MEGEGTVGGDSGHVEIFDPTSLGEIVAVDGRKKAPPTVQSDHISLTPTLAHCGGYELLDTYQSKT